MRLPQPVMISMTYVLFVSRNNTDAISYTTRNVARKLSSKELPMSQCILVRIITMYHFDLGLIIIVR